jgi:2-polyprenyl-3-methyl-5-hydroxy-6-metoxy-1,4-benzoquinol methylase
MDDPGLDPAEHTRALVGLSRLNRLSGSAEVLWPSIRECAARSQRALRILDVATGGGDVPARLAEKAARSGVALDLFGCDKSATAVACAQEKCPTGRFFAHDMFNDCLKESYDIIMCSLFLHHLNADQSLQLFKRMKEAASQLVLVNDLDRSRFAFVAVWAGCHLVTRSRIVRFDGPASVRSAFTAAEAKDLAERAGLTGASVRKQFPCRYLLSWKRP